MTRRVLAVSAAGLLWVAVTGVITAPSAIAPDPLRQQGEACPVQARSTDGPAELAQFDFLVGHWDATVTLQAGGEPKVYKATWCNSWIASGQVMLQQWREPGTTGIELRSFNRDTRRWDGRNLYVPTPGTWYDNEAAVVGNEIVVTSHTRGPDGAAQISRETYHPVNANRFEIRSEVSADAGKTWTLGRYRLVAIRIKGG